MMIMEDLMDKQQATPTPQERPAESRRRFEAPVVVRHDVAAITAGSFTFGVVAGS